MKLNAKTLALVALSLVLAACSHETSDRLFTEQPAQATLVLQDESAVLSCTADGETVTYQWYEAADSAGNSGTPIALATGRTLSTPAFSAPGIRYYYCVASAGDMSEKSRVAAVAYTGLPVLYLDLDRPLASVTKDDYALGKMRIIQPDGTEFEYEFTKSGKEGIKGRGNASWAWEKKGYNIKFDTKQEFFGLPEAKKWCITSNHSDKTLLRNRFVSGTIGNDVMGNRSGGEWSPRFVSVDVVVNGECHGNYLFGERITLTKGRVDMQDITDVKKDKNGDGTVDLYDGGFIVEIDKLYYGTENYFKTTQGIIFTLKDPDEVSPEVKGHIQSVVQTAEDVLYGDEFADEKNGWQNYIDAPSVIDWYIVNELTKNWDAAFRTSVYMYYNPEDKKLHMGPNWDFDISSGNTTSGDCHIPEGWYIRNDGYFVRLFEDGAFKNKLKMRWNEVKTDISRAINADLQSFADGNSVSAELNFIRWNISTKYQDNVDYMRNFLNTRYDWLDGAIEGL